MNNDPLFGQVSSVLLAQLAPAFSTPVTAYVASLRTEIRRLVIANISGVARTFRLSHQEAGGAFTANSALYYDKTIAIGDTFDWSAPAPGSGISVARNGTIMFRSDLTSGLAISIYGVAEAAQR